MVSWTKLLTGQSQDNDDLRYSKGHGHIPKIVVWNATSGCNLFCRHCYFDATRAPGADELSQQEARNFIDDLAKMGVPVLLFSGGEPLLRKDIFELGKFAKDRGIKAILSTNGTLITPRTAEEIKNAGFSYVGVSLDGMEKVNDTFRQSKGAFKASLAGIRNCRTAGLKVGLRFTVTKYNFKELPPIFDLVEEESIPRLCLYHLVYTGRGSNLKEKDLSHREKREVLELLWQRTLNFYQKGLKTEVLTVDNHADGAWIFLKLKKSDPHRARLVLELLKAQGGNGSGTRIGAIDNRGNIYADQFWRTRPLGNIRKDKFSDVWLDEENEFLQALRNRRPLLKGPCRRCNFLEICNGNFRARAEAVFGDHWSEDPACYLRKEETCANDEAYSAVGGSGINA